VPDIDYPCDWTYKVVGRSELVVRRAVSEVLGEEDHRLVPSRQSRTGKYVSLELAFVARDDEHRRGVAQALHEHVDVIYVL